ncbi:MAG: hypothetical protein H7Z37_15740 [Pyrinomonadaceae bacterium]|nr:hypothetical protein [Pyrinomonadaceae bacterium]
MKKVIILLAFVILSGGLANAQTPPQTRPQVAQTSQQPFDLFQYGVRIEPDARLIIVMATLEAAGVDVKDDSVFRREIRENNKKLDDDLRVRIRDFFNRNNKTLINSSPSEQIARYVSLAYVLSAPPELKTPPRSTDLPAGLLEVFDFAPLVQEYYQKSGIAENLKKYTDNHRAYGDSIRPDIIRAVRDVTSYLNTRPVTTYSERVAVTAPTSNTKKSTAKRFEIRSRGRGFLIAPDLLAAPRSVKLRVISDNYYATIGFFNKIDGESLIDSSEFRRAYLQFLVDPLIYQNAKLIAAQKEGIRKIINEQQNQSDKTVFTPAPEVSPDVFLTVSRSLAVAADIRQRKSALTSFATQEARQKIAQTKPSATNPNAPKIVKITDDVTVENNRLTYPRIEKEAFAELSEAYKSGAVLVFFFDEQLKGLEASSFDIAGSFTEMITSFDVAKETARIKSSEKQRTEALTELAKLRQQRREAFANQESNTAAQPDANLLKGLREAEQFTGLKEYDKAEASLKDLLLKFEGEPQIFYALGRNASLSANGVFDEGLRDDRLSKAFAHYKSVILASSEDTPKPLLSLTHVALGKLYDFYEKPDEAMKEFDAAIKIGNVPNGAYQQAIIEKQNLVKK